MFELTHHFLESAKPLTLETHRSIMESNVSSRPHICSACAKPAELICKACKGSPDGNEGLVAVYYCEKACQTGTWEKHKSACRAAKDRRALYRAGEIARHLLYTFNKNRWMWPIRRMDVSGNTRSVFDGERTGKSVIIPFPDALFPNAQDQEAILSYNACNGAVAFLHNLMEDMLKGKP